MSSKPKKAKNPHDAKALTGKTTPPRSAAPLKSPQRRSGYLPGRGNSNERICWRFELVDQDGPWGFHTVNDGAELCEILGHLRNLESMTVGEVFPGGRAYPGKDYDVVDIPNRVAHDRLDAMGLADMTKISVLRLGGEPRLYGFRDAGNIFHVVWWDPHHEIWPSLKKHT